MKLVSFNVWGGKEYNNLISFLNEHKNSTDIFCFQEVFSTESKTKSSHGARMNLYQELCTLFTDFSGSFDSVVEGRDGEGFVEFPVWYGLATFIRKTLKIQEQGSIEVFPGILRPDGHSFHRRTLQYTVIENGGNYIIGNVHGLHLGGIGKGDTPERITQSSLIKQHLKQYPGKKILCGDLNLLPETESIHILEKDMKNLISQYHITTTRNKFYTKGVPFADYTFVSPDVQVHNFEVPYNEASDHLPMILTFK